MKTPACIGISIFMMIAFLNPLMSVHSEVPSVEEKALNYVKAVLPFDMNHYTATIGNSYVLPSAPGYLECQSVKVNLTAADSSISVMCMFQNNAIYQCAIASITGTPILDRQYSGVKDMAARILLGQDKYTGLDSSALVAVIDLVNRTDNSTTVSVGDIALNVAPVPIPTSFRVNDHVPIPDSVDWTSSVEFHWSIKQNGVLFYTVGLTFNNGVFSGLQDARAEYPIGSSTVSITKEQATGNSKSYLANYISKFNLTVINTTASIVSYPRNSVLYPIWLVNVYFDGGIEMVDMKVWADSGEVFECYQGGSPFNPEVLKFGPTYQPSTPSFNQTTLPATLKPATPSQIQSTPAPTAYVANGDVSVAQPAASASPPFKSQGEMWIYLIAVAISAIAITVAGLFVWKKRKPSPQKCLIP